MSLPLLSRLSDASVPFMGAPGAGAQYRFHFDMGRCIGCKCCVVACNEQNGNPAAINWRRVAEMEGGRFPQTRRAYLSMGCNHCVNPTCLSGCPVDAYVKDTATGIVRHSADACIGCQYCTWTCSYGVPQYNPERGVVGKCDLCYGRLEHGQTPACVGACPEGAIQIEMVPIDSWRAAVAKAAPGRGLPARDGSVSTTRVTMPARLPSDVRSVGAARATPQHPHWSLVMMTVLTQLSVGAFVTTWLMQVVGASAGLAAPALMALCAAVAGLGGATFHLGRPVYAYRALKAWRHSWLSREVLLFTLFTVAGALYTGALWSGFARAAVLGCLTSLLGIAAVTASAFIYRVPSRPAWNTPLTLVQFNLTAGALGPLLTIAVGGDSLRWVPAAAAAMAASQLVLIAVRFVRLVAGGDAELKATARLLSTTLKGRFIARGLLLAVGGIVLPLAAHSAVLLWAALAIALAAEILGRYLFFVSAVPRHMAAPYVEFGSEAA